jgi:hypothetical protein
MSCLLAVSARQQKRLLTEASRILLDAKNE